MDQNLDRWYVVRCNTSKESIVQGLLCRDVCLSYFPVIKERRRWSDRVKTVEAPLFPSYVLIQAEDPLRIRQDMRRVPYLIDYLWFDRRPAYLSSKEVEGIKKMVDSDESVSVWKRIFPGQKVRLIMGRMAGLEGVISKMDGADHVVVNVNLLNRAVSVRVEQELVEAL